MMPAQVDRRITLDQLVILINQSQCVIQNEFTQASPIQKCLEERSSARTLVNRSLVSPSTCMVFHMLEVCLKSPIGRAAKRCSSRRDMCPIYRQQFSDLPYGITADKELSTSELQIHHF
jgi:hypothetical protein